MQRKIGTLQGRAGEPSQPLAEAPWGSCPSGASRLFLTSTLSPLQRDPLRACTLRAQIVLYITSGVKPSETYPVRVPPLTQVTSALNRPVSKPKGQGTR